MAGKDNAAPRSRPERRPIIYRCTLSQRAREAYKARVMIHVSDRSLRATRVTISLDDPILPLHGMRDAKPGEFWALHGVRVVKPGEFRALHGVRVPSATFGADVVFLRLLNPNKKEMKNNEQLNPTVARSVWQDFLLFLRDPHAAGTSIYLIAGGRSGCLPCSSC